MVIAEKSGNPIPNPNVITCDLHPDKIAALASAVKALDLEKYRTGMLAKPDETLKTMFAPKTLDIIGELGPIDSNAFLDQLYRIAQR
jgi:hypothetical protein